MTSADHNLWAAAERYEPYVGRWSRLVARDFLPWVRAQSGASWLDVGCGTGVLSQTILEVADPSQVHGIDPSATFIAYARDRVADSRATFTVADAQALPQDFGPFDCVVSGLVLNFIPDQERALTEIMRVAHPGAVVAAYVWDYAGGMELMRHFWDAAVTLDPAAAALDEGPLFPICKPDALGDLFARFFTHVEARAIEVPTIFKDFDDYWSPFLGGVGPAPAYAVSLSDERRELLRQALMERLPIAADGSISLSARAWAAKGATPA